MGLYGDGPVLMYRRRWTGDRDSQREVREEDMERGEKDGGEEKRGKVRSYMDF